MAHKQQLVRLGARDADLTRAVRAGEVIRARRGWYSTLAETDAGLRAVRVGGRLTGISAIQYWGGWVLGRHPLHVSVTDNAARLRDPRDRRRKLRSHPAVSVHWDGVEVAGSGSAVCVSVLTALVRVVLDETVETAVAAIDWALHSGLLDQRDLERLARALPNNKRWIVALSDAACESLPESLSRTRLRMAGHRVRSQVRIGPKRFGAERIDLVVDEIVGLEVDGEEFHLTRFEEDRRKDLAITLEGFHAIRPPARLVFWEWPLVYRAICAAIDARRTGLPPRIQDRSDHPRSADGNWRREDAPSAADS